MTIEQRAEVKYPLFSDKITDSALGISNNQIIALRNAYIAGATEERALMEKEKAPVNQSANNILCKWDNTLHPDDPNTKELWDAMCEEDISIQAALSAMKEYASHQTASLEARVKELETDNRLLINTLQNIASSMRDTGREGCTYGDTAYNSIDAVYGYNLAIDAFKEIANNALKALNPKQQ